MQELESQSLLCCPLDSAPLVRQGNSLRCDSGHSFDLAKEGYANLLPVNKKRTKDPGDSKAMVAARRRFLETQIYDDIAQAMSEFVLDSKEGEALTCLDAGCGEGYYLRYLRSQNNGMCLQTIGLDISKWAIKSAAKADSDTTYVVASNAKLPILNNRIDRLVCMFGFPNYKEFARVMVMGGYLIDIDPGPNHLKSLRALLYPNVKKSAEQEKEIPQGFAMKESRSLNANLELNSQAQIQDLLMMTPHYFRASQQGKDRVGELTALIDTIDVNFRVLVKL